jgi:hypothetical protein
MINLNDQELNARLRRLAEEAAGIARVPGAKQAIRHGRRRRWTWVGATALCLAVALGAVPAIRMASSVTPAASDPRAVLRPGLPPSALPGKQPTFRIVRSATGTVRVEGTWRRFGWRYDASRNGDMLELENGAGTGSRPLNPLLNIAGTTCCEYPVGKARPPEPVLEVLAVTNRAAVVRITFQFHGERLGPVDFLPVGAGPGLPIGIVALERYPNDDAMVFREIILLDGDGRRICQDRFGQDGIYDARASQPDSCNS